MFRTDNQGHFGGSPELWTIAYRSHMRWPMSEQDLAALAVCAAGENRKLGITGVLLFQDEHFAQVIEGDRRVVEALFERIKSDRRHTQVRTLREGPIASRAFTGWAMRLITVQFIAPALRTMLIEALDVLDDENAGDTGAPLDTGANNCSSARVYGAMLTAPATLGVARVQGAKRLLAA